MYFAPIPAAAANASFRRASPAATMSSSSLDTSASKDRPRDVAARRPYSSSTCRVISASTDDGSRSGISRRSYPAALVRAHASRASASDQPPVHTSACTPSWLDPKTRSLLDDAWTRVARDAVVTRAGRREGAPVGDAGTCACGWTSPVALRGTSRGSGDARWTRECAWTPPTSSRWIET